MQSLFYPKTRFKKPSSLAPQAWTPDILYNEGETVQTPDGNCYKARSSTSLKVVAAIPGWANHGAFFVSKLQCKQRELSLSDALLQAMYSYKLYVSI